MWAKFKFGWIRFWAVLAGAWTLFVIGSLLLNLDGVTDWSVHSMRSLLFLVIVPPAIAFAVGCLLSSLASQHDRSRF